MSKLKVFTFREIIHSLVFVALAFNACFLGTAAFEADAPQPRQYHGSGQSIKQPFNPNAKHSNIN